MKSYGFLFSIVVCLVALCAPAAGEWNFGFTDDGGVPITEIHVAPGQPFSVNVTAIGTLPPYPEVAGYEMEMNWSFPGMELLEYVDANGWDLFLNDDFEDYASYSATNPGLPAPFTNDIFVLGSATFQAEPNGSGDEPADPGNGEPVEPWYVSALMFLSDGEGGMEFPTGGDDLLVFTDGTTQTFSHVWTDGPFAPQDFNDTENWREPGGVAPHPFGAPDVDSDCLFEHPEGDAICNDVGPVNSLTFRGGAGGDIWTHRDYMLNHPSDPLVVGSDLTVEQGSMVQLDFTAGITIGGNVTVGDTDGGALLHILTGFDFAAPTMTNLNLTDGPNNSNRNRFVASWGDIDVLQKTTIGEYGLVYVSSPATFITGELEVADFGALQVVGLAETGFMLVNASGSVIVHGDFTSGAGSQIHGTVHIHGDGFWTAGAGNPQAVWGGVTFQDVDGEVICANLQLRGGELGPGLNGTGRIIGNMENGSWVRPGLSIGTVTVTGNYVQNLLPADRRGILEIEVESGSSFDQLIVQGDAFLGNRLDLQFDAAFALELGMAMTIVDITGASSGSFKDMGWSDIVEGQSVFNDGPLDLFISYIGGDGNDVVLWTVSDLATPGDTNGDRIVDDLDLVNLIAQFGGPPGAESADFNGDNLVDLEDLATMRENFGLGSGAAPVGDLGVTTPEPATMTLLALGAVVVLRRRN